MPRIDLEYLLMPATPDGFAEAVASANGREAGRTVIDLGAEGDAFWAAELRLKADLLRRC